MILRFPDLESITWVIQEDCLPKAVLKQPVCYQFIGTEIHVQSDSLPTKVLPKIAKRLTIQDAALSGETFQAVNWYALIPPERVSKIERSTPEQVCFVCSHPTQLVGLISEMHRLGQPARGFRCVEQEGTIRFLLLAHNPPTFTLQPGSHSQTIQVFTERSKNVWVEWGFQHSCEAILSCPRNHQVFLNGAGEWFFFPIGKIWPIDQRSIWEDLLVRTAYVLGTDLDPLMMPLRLQKTKRRGLPVDVWIISEEPMQKLQQFLQNNNEEILEQLDFTLAQLEGKSLLILRVSSSRNNPPSFVMDATSFTSIMQLPNLYQPVQEQLVPMLRRDVLRNCFSKSGQFVWLYAEGSSLRIGSLPLEAFRPLFLWVDYITPKPNPQKALAIDTSFIRLEDFEVRLPTDANSTNKTKHKTRSTETVEEIVVSPQTIQVRKGVAPQRVSETILEDVSLEEFVGPKTLTEAVTRLGQLEQQFHQVQGALNHPDRLRLLLAIADCYLKIGHPEDAWLCWLPYLWESKTWPAALLQQMTARESPKPDAEWIGADLDLLLEQTTVSIKELRPFIGWLLQVTNGANAPFWLKQRLNVLTQFMERNEILFPVRLAWLCWLAFAQLADGDILTLTRARDRLLQALLETGLLRDRDFPSFLRSGQGTQTILVRMDSSQLQNLHRKVLQWAASLNPEDNYKSANGFKKLCIDLIFAYGFAVFGDQESSRSLLHRVGKPPTRKKDPLPDHHGAWSNHEIWIWKAYMERVEQRLAGLPLGQTLSKKVLEEWQKAKPDDQREMDRFRQISKILEPHARTDPYRHQRGYRTSDLGTHLNELQQFTDTEAYVVRVPQLLKQYSAVSSQLQILSQAIPRAFYLGESFAVDMLQTIPMMIERMPKFIDLPDLIQLIQLLELSIGLAAHLDRKIIVHQMTQLMFDVLEKVQGERVAWLISSLSGDSFRFLSRFGLHEQAKRWFDALHTGMMGKQSFAAFMNQPGLNLGVVLPALLRLVAGWYYFEQEDWAKQTFQTARHELLNGSWSTKTRSELAVRYLSALCHAPLPLALGHMEHFMKHYRVDTQELGIQLVVQLTETMVLGMTVQDFSMDHAIRRLLDEDEFLIRQRIHRDIQQAIAQAGLG